MSHKIDRVEVPYVWPTALKQPERPPYVVYLDLNHWISLAKAVTGHRQGASYVEAFEACRTAVLEDRAVFPICDSLYAEIAGIGQYRQRRDLRQAIELISEHLVITARSAIITLEVDAMLDELIGPRPDPFNEVDYLDWGVSRAFGIVGGWRIVDDAGADLTTAIRAGHPEGPEAFDELMWSAQLELNRTAIEGPTAKEEPHLRELGWNPQKLFELTNERAELEMAQVSTFATYGEARRRLRDVVAARVVLIDINEILFEGLKRRGATLESVFPTPGAMRASLDAMPSFDVVTTLRAAYHQNLKHRWTRNDIHDIDALGSALPYCDVVVTDKAAAHHVIRSGLDSRLSTRVFSNLDQLVEWLDP